MINLQYSYPPVTHSISFATKGLPIIELAIVESAPEKKKQDVGPTSFLLKTKADFRTVRIALLSSSIMIRTVPHPAR